MLIYVTAKLHKQLDSGFSDILNVTFLSLQIPNNLRWTTNTSEIVKKAQQRFYFL